MIKHQIEQLLKKVKHLQNGDVSRTMKRLGLCYGINYGVSVPQLRQIANQAESTNELALELLKLDIREAKLLASMLIDVNLLNFDDLCLISSYISNTELVEHFSRNIYARHCELHKLLPILEGMGYWQQMLAIYSASWNLKFAAVKNEKVIQWSNTTLTNLMVTDDMQLIKALSFLMPSISAIDTSYHDKMVNLAESMAQSEKIAVRQMARDFMWLNAI